MSEHAGKIWWNELVSNDIEKSLDYYKSLMGWTVEEMPMPDGKYYIFKHNGETKGGAMPATPQMGNVPDHWLTYFAVADVDASTKANEAAGGKTMNGPFDVPEVGRMSIVSDPTGAFIGIITPPPGHP